MVSDTAPSPPSTPCRESELQLLGGGVGRELPAETWLGRRLVHDRDQFLNLCRDSNKWPNHQIPSYFLKRTPPQVGLEADLDEAIRRNWDVRFTASRSSCSRSARGGDLQRCTVMSEPLRPLRFAPGAPEPHLLVLAGGVQKVHEKEEKRKKIRGHRFSSVLTPTNIILVPQLCRHWLDSQQYFLS